MTNAPRIGIDLGGTKIEIQTLSKDGNVLFKKRISTPAPDYMATIKVIAGLVSAAENAIAGTASIGIGTPGSISPKTGLLRNSNSVWMNGKALAEDIKTAFAREVRLANDANCFSLSEAVDGAGKEANTVFGIIIGTAAAEPRRQQNTH